MTSLEIDGRRLARFVVAMFLAAAGLAWLIRRL